MQLDSIDTASPSEPTLALQFRESLDAQSAFCASGVRLNLRWQPIMLFRDIAGEQGDEIAEDPNQIFDWGKPPNLWIRCERRGDLFVGLSSKDRTSWSMIGEHTAALPRALLAGISIAAQGESAISARVCDLQVETADAFLPVPRVLAPTNAVVGQETQFDATGSLPGGTPITEYLWDFGDGGKADGPRASHVYLDLRQFHVTLTLKDGVGRTVKTVFVLRALEHPLPDGWLLVDLPGTVNGRAKAVGECIEVAASGTDVILSIDTATMLYKEADGDILLRARVSDITGGIGGAAIGVMLKESTDPLSRYAFAALFHDLIHASNGLKFTFAWREEKEKSDYWESLESPLPVPPDAWLQIERQGDTLIASFSTDGANWQELGRNEFLLPLPRKLLAGLAVSTHCWNCPDGLHAEFCEVKLESGVPAHPALFRRGDLDGNATVNLTDAIITLHYLFHGSGAIACPDAADTNNDGEIDVTDAIRLVNFLFRSGPPPEAPGPDDCGEDPGEEDALPACRSVACG